MLGDLLERALTVAGVTPERVERWLGKPCNCEERKEKLNQLSYWSMMVLTGKLRQAKHYLDLIIGEKSDAD